MTRGSSMVGELGPTELQSIFLATGEMGPTRSRGRARCQLAKFDQLSQLEWGFDVDPPGYLL